MDGEVGTRAATRILIVEDEAIAARNLMEVLERLGYRVVGTAADADQALYLAKLHEPELTIVDVVLQGRRDGISLARILRDEMDIGVIFLTSHADTVTVGRAAALQPLGYLVKPVRRDDVYAAVEMALARRVETEADPVRTLVARNLTGDGGLHPSLLNKVADHIDRHFNRAITLAELADLAGLSPGHFAQMFKRSTGQSPYQAVVTRRMQEAKSMLAQTDRPIAEVAMAVGYESQSHFTTAFKRVVGATPAAFRRL